MLTENDILPPSVADESFSPNPRVPDKASKNSSLGKPFDPGGGALEARDIRYDQRRFISGRIGNRVSFGRRQTQFSMNMDDSSSDDEDLGRPQKNRQTSEPKLLVMKRPSEFEGSERSCYQPYVKTDEDIALDICNTFWRPGLTFSAYKHGDRLVSFEELWPCPQSLRTLLNEAYQATSLRRSVLDITKLALRCAPVSLIQELINSRIINIDQVFENGSTMLHLACVARNIEVVTFLCNAGINHRALDKYGRTAEQVCFDSRVRRLLPMNNYRTMPNSGSRAQTPSLRKVASKNEKDNVFVLAREPRRFDELQIKLQTLDFDVNEDVDEDGNYLIHVVVGGGLCELPQLLSLVRDEGADVDLCNKQGMTALMIAAADGNTVLVDVLLCVLGSNPNKPNSLNGRCAIHYAAKNNRAEVANCLIKRGGDFNLEDFSGLRPDDVAKANGSYESEEIITTSRRSRVENFSDSIMNGVLNAQDLRVTDLFQLTELGETLIMLAARYNRINNLKILICREGCPIDAQHGDTGRTALATACVNGHVAAVTVLMRHDANAGLKDIDGLLPIHHAVIADNCEVADVILQYQRALIGLHAAYLNARSQQMRKLLRTALGRRQSEIVTPALFEMSLTGEAESLYCLLEEGDDVNPISSVGNWPLYLAADYGYLDVIKLLHHFRGDFTKKHPSSKNSILHVACERGHYEIVKFLLKYTSQRSVKGQLDVNAFNNEGKTPLHLAAEKGSRKTVQLLLDFGASTAVPSATGGLISSPHYLGVQFLIEKKREEHMKSIVQALKEKKNVRMLHDVFEPKFDHNLRDASGDTPLMIASRHGNFLAVKYLLMSAVKHTEDHLSDSDDDSGIMTAVGKQRQRSVSLHTDEEEGPSWMIASTGHIDSVQERRGRLRSKVREMMANNQHASKIRPRFHSGSTLNLASDEEMVADSLLALSMGESHVSDVNPLDGRAAIHRIIEYGDEVSITQALVEADRNCVNIQDNHGLSPLHLSCKLSRKKIVQSLVKMLFVDLNIRTLDGKLPEEMCYSKRLENLIKVTRQGDDRRSSTNLNSGGVDFDDSASQAGAKTPQVQSTLLNFDALNDQFYCIRDKVTQK